MPNTRLETREGRIPPACWHPLEFIFEFIFFFFFWRGSRGFAEVAAEQQAHWPNVWRLPERRTDAPHWLLAALSGRLRMLAWRLTEAESTRVVQNPAAGSDLVFTGVGLKG